MTFTRTGYPVSDSLPRTRERAVDILDELIGQQQRQWRRSQRWQDNRKSSVDSSASGSSVRRRVDYSSDSDAQFGPDRTRLDQRGPAERLLSESALYNGNAFSNEAILDRWDGVVVVIIVVVVEIIVVVVVIIVFLVVIIIVIYITIIVISVVAVIIISFLSFISGLEPDAENEIESARERERQREIDTDRDRQTVTEELGRVGEIAGKGE